MNNKNQIMFQTHGKLDKIMNLLTTVNFYPAEFQQKQLKISYKTVLLENGTIDYRIVFGCRMMKTSLL